MHLKRNYFEHDGRPFWPVGFNYWPSGSGVHCWKNFNLDEWCIDFEAIRANGYNTVRIIA